MLPVRPLKIIRHPCFHQQHTASAPVITRLVTQSRGNHLENLGLRGDVVMLCLLLCIGRLLICRTCAATFHYITMYRKSQQYTQKAAQQRLLATIHPPFTASRALVAAALTNRRLEPSEATAAALGAARVLRTWKKLSPFCFTCCLRASSRCVRSASVTTRCSWRLVGPLGPLIVNMTAVREMPDFPLSSLFF